MNNILNNINIFKKYTQHEVIDPNISLDELIEKINNKKDWNIKDSKDILDILYEIEKNEYKNKKKLSDDERNKITFYKSYIQHQIDFIKHLQNHLLSLVATVFIPLGFITGFFGMNFKSMGAPSLNNNGILNLKNGHNKITILSIILVILGIYVFNNILTFI